MESWRRQKGEFYHQDVQGARSNPRKPPAGNWQQRVQTVPSWEKKFCFVVGSVPWRKLVETKKYMYLYENVVNWNDSAGEEAFQNAKNRFWAEMNGLPYDAPSPDPDVYVDEIDWDSKIDEELLLDLDEGSLPSEGHKDENVVIIGDPLLLNPTFSCVGWGEAEEDIKKQTELSSNSGHRVENSVRNNDDKNPWESICAQNNGTMMGLQNSSWGRDDWDKKYSGWDVYNAPEAVNDKGTEHVWGTWGRDCWNREEPGLNMSRYKTTRYTSDEHQIARGGRGGRGKRLNLGCEQPFLDRRSSRQWQSSYCRPVSHDISNKAGNSWGW